MTRISGIDVSEFQRDIDWPTVARTQRFAVLRCTRGSSMRVDARFHEYAAGASSVGLPWTGYHFAWPNTSAIEQADLFAQTLGGYPYSLPPVLDLETKPLSQGGTRWSYDNLNREQRTAWAITFCERFEAVAGVRPMIYCSGLYPPGFLVDTDQRLARFPLWIAWYNRTTPPPAPAPWTKWHIWQWSDQNRVAGVQGNSAGATDLNWSTEADLAELMAMARPEPETTSLGEVAQPAKSDIDRVLRNLGFAEARLARVRRQLEELNE